MKIFIFLDVTHEASLLGSIEMDKPLGKPAAEVTTLEMGIPAAPKAKTAGEPKTAGAAPTELTKTQDDKPAASTSKAGNIYYIL